MACVETGLKQNLRIRETKQLSVFIYCNPSITNSGLPIIIYNFKLYPTVTVSEIG